MTTEELIKALREKPSRDNRKFLDEVADCVEMLQNAIFALNEELIAQRTEIEQQASLILSLSSIKTTVINDAKAEAVKEFVEMIKAKNRMAAFLWGNDLDRLVKEFTEGQE